MNSDLQIPKHVTLSEHENGFAFVDLIHSSGARAKVSLYGGQLLSWKSADGTELLYLSPIAEFTKGKAIRGGIPIVFPQFGANGPLPSHGFARTSFWKAIDSAVEKNGKLKLVIQLSSNPDSIKIWPHEFELTLTIRLSEALELELKTENKGSAPFNFQSLLHTYFQVPDITKVRIDGLGGAKYTDFLREKHSFSEPPGLIAVNRFTDQVYLGAPNKVELMLDGTRRLVIEKSNFRDLVFWNPWIEKTKSFKDLPAESYKQFVCLEAGNIDPVLSLAPAETHLSTHSLRLI